MLGLIHPTRAHQAGDQHLGAERGPEREQERELPHHLVRGTDGGGRDRAELADEVEVDELVHASAGQAR